MPQTTAKKGLFTCASDAAESVSIAADLHKVPGLKSGVGGFAATALFGNPISGLTDLVTSFVTGEGGGHNVFYNMALGVAAGPTQGFGPLFGNSIGGTPWGASPTDLVLGALGAEYATGVGEANLAFSAITYGASAVGCFAGWIH